MTPSARATLDDLYRTPGKAELIGGKIVEYLASGDKPGQVAGNIYASLPLPANRMRLIEGPPTFAAEVRSENDYGPAAEAAMGEKRADYFAAGTQVVWDVDLEDERIDAYRSTDPGRPVTIVAAGSPMRSPHCPAGTCRSKTSSGWRPEVHHERSPGVAFR